MFQDKKKNNNSNFIFHDFEFSIFPQKFNDNDSKDLSFSDFSSGIYESSIRKNIYSIFSDYPNDKGLFSKDEFKVILTPTINSSKLLGFELNPFLNNGMLNLLTYLPQDISSDIAKPFSNNFIINSPSSSSSSNLQPNDDSNNKNDDFNVISYMTNNYSTNKKSRFLDFILYDESFDEGQADSSIFGKDFYSSLTHQSKNQINIHTGNFAKKITDYFNADAVTVLGNIFFSKGKFGLSTPSGISLFIHELTHAKQLSSKADTNISQYSYNDLEQEAISNENKTLRYTNFIFNDRFQYGIHKNSDDDDNDEGVNNFLNSFKQPFNLVLDNNNTIFNSKDITKSDSFKYKSGNHDYPKYVSNIRTFLTPNYDNDQIGYDDNEKSIHSDSIGNENVLIHDSIPLDIHVTNNRFSPSNQRQLNTSFSRNESLPEKISLTPFFAKRDRSLESSSSFPDFPNIESPPTNSKITPSNSPFLETKIDIESLAKKVLDILERKIKIERARRGIW